MRGARPSKRGAERWFERAPFYFAAKAAPSEENCCCEYGLLVTVRFGVALVVDLCDALKCCDAAQAEDLGRSGRRSRGGAIHALLEWSDSARRPLVTRGPREQHGAAEQHGAVEQHGAAGQR